jgi:hypothetical protein
MMSDGLLNCTHVSPGPVSVESGPDPAITEVNCVRKELRRPKRLRAGTSVLLVG